MTDEQRAQVKNIRRHYQTSVKSVRLQVRSQLVRVFEDAEIKIRAILRPDQQAKFDKFAAHGKACWEQMNR